MKAKSKTPGGRSIEGDEDILRSERRYRYLYNLSPVMMKTVDLDGRIIDANDAYVETLGYSREEILGRRSVEFLTAASRERVDREAEPERIARRGVVKYIEVQLVTKSGGIVDAELSVAGQFNEAGELECIHSAFVNISDRIQAERLRSQNVFLNRELSDLLGTGEMIGSSPAMVDVFRNVKMVAGTDSTVLLTGETGTGKELIARAIHNLSPRGGRPMVCLNCAALPVNLVESELFGHEKGAFTGATARKLGRFEASDGSTIFLDEVGELPPETQTKLLRVLQEQEFQRVGGSDSIRIDVRVVAATNRDLADAVKAGQFRADLFYRLNIFPVRLPPLRERREDIPLLAKHFLSRYSDRMGKRISEVSPVVVDLLKKHNWPGNVRELANVIERAVIFCPGTIIQKEHIVGLSVDGAPGSPTEFLTLEEMERRHLIAALEKTCGVVAGAEGAAKLLNMNRSTLASRMQKLGIRPSRKPPFYDQI
jgi:formate hydrogenlyase transcriptional activator